MSKLLVFSFEPLVMQKVQKVESIKIYRVIAKQGAKREQCVYTQWKSRLLIHRMEIANTQNDYKTTSKKLRDKKKTNLFCEFCKSALIPRKQVQDCSKEFLGNNNKKDFLENPSLHDKNGQSKAKDWQ